MATATKCGRAELERCPALRNGDGNRSEDGGSHVFLFFFGAFLRKTWTCHLFTVRSKRRGGPCALSR